MIKFKTIIEWAIGKLYDLPSLYFEVKHCEDDDSYSIETYNDDKTTMDFVVNILEKYFNLSRKNAIKVMTEIHTNGKHSITGFEKNSADRLTSHIDKVAKKYSFPIKCCVQKI